MARLSTVAGMQAHPLIIEAHLQQGLVVDRFYGLALDGILASQVRKEAAIHLGLGRAGGADLDGGLSGHSPVDWALPLAQCIPSTQPDDWHWACSIGTPLGLQDRPVANDPPDTHRFSTQLDSRRAYQVAVKVPSTAGGSSGRFRPRVTPVLAIPALRIAWTAVGDVDEVRRLLGSIPAIGGRRGAGEGAVLRWEVTVASQPDELWHFAHRSPWSQGLARPMPAECAEQMGSSPSGMARAGVRPPLIHPARQRLLAMP